MNVNMKDFTRIKSRTEKYYFWKKLLIIYVFLAAKLTYNSKCTSNRLSVRNGMGKT